MAGMQGHNASSQGFQPVRLSSDARATAPAPIGGLDDESVEVPRAALLDMLRRLEHLTSDEFSNGGDRSLRAMLAAYAGVDVDDYQPVADDMEWDHPLHIDPDDFDGWELEQLESIGSCTVWDVAGEAVEFMHEHGLFGDGPSIERDHHRDDADTFEAAVLGADGVWLRCYIGEGRHLFGQYDFDSLDGLEPAVRGARAVEMVHEASRFAMRKVARQAAWMQRTLPPVAAN